MNPSPLSLDARSSFALLGSRDLPHREGLVVLGVPSDPLAGVRDGDSEALVLESEQIHCLVILVVYQKRKKNFSKNRLEYSIHAKQAAAT